MNKKQPISNSRLADFLQEISLYLQAEGVAFRPKAYMTASETIRGLDEELSDTVKRCGDVCLKELPGIGAGMIQKIHEYLTTGRVVEHEELKQAYPFDMLGFTRISHVGPKTAMTLYQELGVKTLDELEKAAKAGRLAPVKGLGVKTQQHVLEGLAFLAENHGRQILHTVYPFATKLVAQMRELKGVLGAEVCGSLRRRKETIGDLDILLIGEDFQVMTKALRELPDIASFENDGETLLRVMFRDGMRGDIRLMKPDMSASALVHFTGSKEHNVLLRERAHTFGLTLSEYGLFKGEKALLTKTEADVYKHLKLDFIPPELREARGEIETAEKHVLPDLVAYGSIKGDLQVQTNWTDGSHSVEDMALAAQRVGLTYMAVTDHTKSLGITGGLDEKRLLRQGEEIDRVNKLMKGFRILKSTECDVGKDGSLDLKDEALKTLDLVCISVHLHTAMSQDEMTERVIRAFKNPYVNVFFHPTGRIVNTRPAYRLDMARVIRAAKEYGVILEVNASERLDLSDVHVRECVTAGIPLVVDSDAHAPEHFAFLDYGVAQARRGWATGADVLNTLEVDEFLERVQGMRK